MNRNRLTLPKLSGQLGVGLCVLGFLLVFLGWNGAASRDRVPAQFPYLLSGGIAGLCLVILGVGMIVVQNQRADRAALQASIDRLREAVERSAGQGPHGNGSAVPAGLADDVVLAGPSSYHRPGCRLVANRDEAEPITLDEATARGLAPCRVCQPQEQPATVEPEEPEEPEEPGAPRTRQRQLRAGE